MSLKPLPSSSAVGRGHQRLTPRFSASLIAVDRQDTGVDSLQGQLLIAAPGLLDPNFFRTVVLVTEHNDEGAAGLVLNRPSPAPVAELVPQLEELADDGDQVWFGGPVQPDAVLVLGEFLDPDDAAVPLFGALGFPSLDAPADVASETSRRRVFAGYAGWGAGQLESEIARDDWFLEPALPDDPFTEDPEALWADVLRRKGGIFELVARMPENPSVN
jgi:putative transcriptional regulator